MSKNGKNWLIAGAVVLVLIIFLLLYLARTQSEKYNSEMSKFYRFDSVKSFTYSWSMRGPAPGPMSFDEINITSDTINGRAVWVEKINHKMIRREETENHTNKWVYEDYGVDEIWIDKSTFECLSQPSNLSYEESPCVTLQLEYLGNETCYLGGTPSETFNCDKYVAHSTLHGYNERFVYWVTKSIPVPVRVEIGEETSSGEFAGYHDSVYLVNYT